MALVLPLCTLLPKHLARAEAPAAVASATPAQPELSASLQRALDELGAWAKQHRGSLGAAIQEVGSAAPLAAHGERRLLNPASNQKIVTAAAALARLGPAYRYTTGLYGKLRGEVMSQLTLRGHGDPSLQTADLYAMAEALVGMGLRRIEGDVLVDQSRFDDAFVPPAFGQQPDEWAAFRAPVSAVAIDRNAIEMNVSPGAPGKPAHVWFSPPGAVEVAGTVTTEAQGKGQAVRWSLAPGGKKLKATIGGHVAAGLPRLRFSRRLDDPRLVPGFVLAQALERFGVKIGGKVSLGGANETHRLVHHESPPLSELLAELGKRSDNFYAEMIFKTLGAESGSTPARSADGATVVLDHLKQVGALEPKTTIKNGSGLFDANLISAASLVKVLDAAARDPRLAPEFIAQLAVGGVDGTLRSRFREHRDRRAVRAKTGTLNDVVSLSGYVLGPDGKPPVAFSFIVADVRGKHHESRRRIDRIVNEIVEARW